MAEWSGEYISPYAEHGKKSEQVKKITVSIPLKVLKILTDERTRRQVNNLRHATNSELLPVVPEFVDYLKIKVD